MQVSDAYRLYRSLDLHFKGKFDYIRYGAGIRVSEAGFKRLPYPEQKFITDLKNKRDPERFLIGNLVFNNIKWVLDYSSEYELHVEKYYTNGLFYFNKDLQKLKPDIKDNILIRNSGDIPYLIEKFENKEISMHTLCIFNHFFNAVDRWQKSESAILISEINNKISRSTGFFLVNLPKYKESIANHFGLQNK